jgi:hypothetical protein
MFWILYAALAKLIKDLHICFLLTPLESELYSVTFLCGHTITYKRRERESKYMGEL